MMMEHRKGLRPAPRRAPDGRGPAPSGGVPKDLSWEAATELFIQCWRADHPGIRQSTLDHYREQLESRLAAFAEVQGIQTADSGPK